MIAFLLFQLFLSPFGENADPSAQEIVDKSIAWYGGVKNFNPAALSFDFRDRAYTYHQKGGQFVYTRSFTDTSGLVLVDRLDNMGLERTANGSAVTLTDKDQQAYTNSINSVIYFAFLPWRLNDPAAMKTYLGQVSIKGKAYHKISVTFRQEGGGVDHDDVFIYWIGVAEPSLDYLAYSFQVDGGGLRFREAVNRRKVGKIKVQDYINYAPKDSGAALESLDKLFEKDELKMLSRIELRNVVWRRKPYNP